MANLANNVKEYKYWNQVNQSRKEYLRTFTSTSTCSVGHIPGNDISALVTSVEEKLGLKADCLIHENITAKSLLTASKMLAYLSFCPPKGEMDAKLRNDLIKCVMK